MRENGFRPGLVVKPGQILKAWKSTILNVGQVVAVQQGRMKLVNGRKRSPVESFGKARIEDGPFVDVGNAYAVWWRNVAEFFDYAFQLTKDMPPRIFGAEVPVRCKACSIDPLHDDVHRAVVFEGGVDFWDRDGSVSSDEFHRSRFGESHPRGRLDTYS